MDLRDQLQRTLGTTYALERELGGGGMSRVFVADERRLNRKVVIKVLSPELAAGVSGDRFEREIQLAASLQQANIVPILAAGETEGLPFYTMPFVEGESLRVRLGKEGRLPVGTVVGAVRDVAKALAYAHERGVVHRDIKPDNVLLSGGTAVVTDFGIAKAISAARTDNENTALTQLGTSIGTPAYMSPEQAAGDPTVDNRADIYSLGCMAYELLTGQTPFHGRTVARTLAAHLSEAPKPVSELRPEVPGALHALVMRCLEKDPAARPQSGQGIIEALDSITSTGMTATPASLLAGPGALRRSLLAYAGAFVAVAILARASIVAFGLPDWVFMGAVIVMLLGLPVILFTWYVSRIMSGLATTMPAVTPGGSAAKQNTLAMLAIKASPHVSWRRTWTGGAVALGVFVVLVGAFMALRAMGIGPAGSLLAAGKLSDRERLIVTEFQSPDTSLSTLVTEAVRTNLGQSRVVSIMPPAAIGAALQRMQRPPASRLDLKLAQEIAQREGVKAIVDGAIRMLGADYVVSMRLVSADSASELAAFQETANGSRELLEKIDALTRKLRGRIGESLRDVRGSPPLEQVTTPSLEALRIYAEAARSIDMGANPLEAAERLREAVRIDTQFAMAYRKLGVALNNAGLPRIRVDSALEQAFRHRNRLTERERLLAEGTYYQLGPGRDRNRAIRAYEALLAIDPNESGAANNLGSVLSGRREFARAESIFKAQIATGRATSQQYTNLMGVLFNGGKVEEAERLAADYKQRFPAAPMGTLAPVSLLYQRGEIDSMTAVLRELAKSTNPVLKVNGMGGLANVSVLRGRIDDAYRHGREAQRLAQSLGQPAPLAINDSLSRSWVELMYGDDTTRALRRMEAAIAMPEWRRAQFDFRPYTSLVAFFANAGNTQRARALLAQFDADVPDSVTRRIRQPERHAMLGSIAAGERRFDEAIREFWKADTTYDGPDGNCAICVLDDIGWVWNKAGVADSAIYYWERYLSTPYFGRQGMDASQRALMVKRLGELYDSKGDVQNAAKRYREFLELWKNADPKFQPKVADVRRKLARLADMERKS
jgi:tetratricopeptide (TPR) repeat protein